MAKPMSKRVGTVVQVMFFDHVKNGPEINCVVYGKIIKSTKLSYTIASWDIITSNKVLRKNNMETFTILKSTIVSLKELFSI